MKKVIVLAIAATLAGFSTAHADAYGLTVGLMGNGMAIGGSWFGTTHHHHKNYYAPPPGYDQGGYPPPPPPGYGGGCDFKSKMQGQVKCGGGGGYAPPPAPGYGYGYGAPPPGNYPGVYEGPYSHPVVVPTLCQPFYYQEFVPGYGWQVLRNYRC